MQGDQQGGGASNFAAAQHSAELKARNKELRLRRLWDFLLTSQSAFDLDEFHRYDVIQATTETQLASVLDLRRRKYGEYSPEIEPEDLAPNTELYLTVDPKGVPVASMRFTFDLFGNGLLMTHRLTTIPTVWQFRADGSPSRLAEGIRLCNAGRSRREMLIAKLWLWFKVYWRCEDLDVDWMLALARPPINDDYRRMNYKPPGAEPHWVTPAVYPVAHELLALNIKDRSAAWHQPTHWMYRAIHERPAAHRPK